jgi:AcrR family transcriptional regulator
VATPETGTTSTESRPAVTKQAIVAEALRQIDERGVDAFSIRQVAAVLDVTSMAIHWHAGTRQQVLDWVLDEVLAGIEPALDPSRSWQERVIDTLVAVRAHVLEHPNVVDLMTKPTRFAPAIASIGASILELFIEEGGLSARAAVQLHNLVVVYLAGALTIGKVAASSSAADRAQGRVEAREAIGDTTLDLMDEFDASEDPEADFRRGLEILLSSASPPSVR